MQYSFKCAMLPMHANLLVSNVNIISFKDISYYLEYTLLKNELCFFVICDAIFRNRG